MNSPIHIDSALCSTSNEMPSLIEKFLGIYLSGYKNEC